LILKPPKLEKGQTVGIVSPASPMKPDRLSRGIKYIEKCGYKVKLGSHVRDVYGYLAGSDKDRAGEIDKMFIDKEVHAVFCTRGGYGTPRLLELINFETLKSHPKVFVGFSDITALQLAIFQATQLVTFSGPMPAVEMGRGIDAFTEQHFWNMIASSGPIQALSGLRCIKPGVTSGRLLGGNLSMICSLIGTPYLPDFQDTILFLEDVGEELYRIDRKLMQLKLAGILQKVRGILIGQFTICEPKSVNPSLSLEQILHDIFFDLNIPIAEGLKYGHIDVKYTLPLGAEVYLDAKEGYLQINDSPVT